MRNSAVRKKKYAAKTDGVLSHKQIAAHRKGFSGAIAGQVQTEIAVKNILTRRGVMVGFIHFYMDFGKKVMQLKKNYSGDTMRDEVEALQVHWAHRGLDVSVLDEIKGWASVIGFCFKLDHSLLDGPDVLC